MTSKIDKLIAAMSDNPRGVRYVDLCKVCDFYFGDAGHGSSSHRIYRTGAANIALVNIQRGTAGKAKPYQVRQVLKALAEKES